MEYWSKIIKITDSPCMCQLHNLFLEQTMVSFYFLLLSSPSFLYYKLVIYKLKEPTVSPIKCSSLATSHIPVVIFGNLFYNASYVLFYFLSFWLYMYIYITFYWRYIFSYTIYPDHSFPFFYSQYLPISPPT